MRVLILSRPALICGRLVLGGTFIYASLDKIAFPNEFAKIVINYQLLPKNVAVVFSYILPWVELGLGVIIVVGLSVREAAFGLSLLLLMFVGAIIYKSLTSTLENCGCFSKSAEAPPSLLFILGRDAALLAIAALLIAGGGKRRSPLDLKS